MTETSGGRGNGLDRQGLSGFAALRLRSCKLQAKRGCAIGCFEAARFMENPRDLASRGFFLQLAACSCRPKAGRLEVRFCVFSQCRARYALQVDVYAVGKVFEAFGQIGQA